MKQELKKGYRTVTITVTAAIRLRFQPKLYSMLMTYDLNIEKNHGKWMLLGSWDINIARSTICTHSKQPVVINKTGFCHGSNFTLLCTHLIHPVSKSTISLDVHPQHITMSKLHLKLHNCSITLSPSSLLSILWHHCTRRLSNGCCLQAEQVKYLPLLHSTHSFTINTQSKQLPINITAPLTGYPQTHLPSKPKIFVYYCALVPVKNCVDPQRTKRIKLTHVIM